jgi:tetratricopeptide (TPR) repeat protein
MKISSIILLFFFALKVYAQSLSKEATDYVNKYKIIAEEGDTNLFHPKNLLSTGQYAVYVGDDKIGNELMHDAILKLDTLKGEDYRTLSVQNTKNGNYVVAIDALEKAVKLDSTINGYYGWVLLYYYHDYAKALRHLEKYDALTPTFCLHAAQSI